MKLFKYIAIQLLLIMFVVTGANTAAQFYIEGEQINFDITPDEITEDCYLPLDQLEEKLDIAVSELKNDKYLIFHGGDFYIITINNPSVKTRYKNGNLNNYPLYINNHILVPLEFIKDFMNIDLEINNDETKSEIKDVEAGIYFDESEIDEQQKLTVLLEIMNTGDEDVKLKFNTGQKYDIIIKDSSGEVVYRWSEGKMFIQAFTELKIKARDSVHFQEELNLPELKEGTYYIKAVIKGEGIRLTTEEKKLKV